MPLFQEARTITIIGAGVLGLTVAFKLSLDKRNRILVIAEFMPGDYDIAYASPWAGANFFPMGEAGSLQSQLEHETWKFLKVLATTDPAACIHIQDAVLYTRSEDVGLAGPLFIGPGEDPWWKDLVEEYRPLQPDNLPDGVIAGVTFKTFCINPAIYLPYLLSECRRRGVIFKRQRVESIAQAQNTPHANGMVADIIVNATGLGSKSLGGVEDRTLYPARGQIAIVENDPGYMMAVSGGKNGQGLGYCMTRASGGGTVVGGCFQKENSESTADLNLATRFIKTVLDFCPSIVKPGEGIEGLKIIRYGVGLRPMRPDGPRIQVDAKDKTIIHCYGHGSYGYQTSWGSAKRVAELLEEVMSKVVRSRL